jgi:hypothetical protein
MGATPEQLEDLQSAAFEHRDAKTNHEAAMEKLRLARLMLSQREEEVVATHALLKKVQRKLEQACVVVAGGVPTVVR